MWTCNKCEEFRLNTVKECHCKEFTVIDDEGAALKFAEESNCQGDYYLMNITVPITVNGKTFHISAEPDVHYRAEEV